MHANRPYRISEPLRPVGTRRYIANTASSTLKIVAFVLAAIAGSANAQSAGPAVQVPDKLKPGADESLAVIAAARGVQIYECRAKKDQPAEYEWAFIAPEAELFNNAGIRIGRHFAGPQWESNDGSRIAGTVKENAPAPAPDSIAWLLLAAKSVGAEGTFSGITSVQRVNTAGGVAPKTGCSQAAAGTRARIDYTADYYFYARK